MGRGPLVTRLLYLSRRKCPNFAAAVTQLRARQMSSYAGQRVALPWGQTEEGEGVERERGRERKLPPLARRVSNLHVTQILLSNGASDTRRRARPLNLSLKIALIGAAPS